MQRAVPLGLLNRRDLLWPQDLQVRRVDPDFFGRCDSLGPWKGQGIDANERARRTPFRRISRTQQNLVVPLHAQVLHGWLDNDQFDVYLGYAGRRG